MLHPDPAALTDPQCKFPVTAWMESILLINYIGANTIPSAIAIVEMDVGIIAASLIVMRPCFETIYTAITRRSSFQKMSPTSDELLHRSSAVSRPLWEKGIVRTIDFKLESQSTSSNQAICKDSCQEATAASSS